jgi:hypothetical protein
LLARYRRANRAQWPVQIFSESRWCFHPLPNISLPKYECRTRAKFRVRMLLICLKLQNGVLRALGQHGKLFRCGTLEI